MSELSWFLLAFTGGVCGGILIGWTGALWRFWQSFRALRQMKWDLQEAFLRMHQAYAILEGLGRSITDKATLDGAPDAKVINGQQLHNH